MADRSGERFERFGLCTVIEKVRRGSGGIAPTRKNAPEEDKALGFGKGQRLKQHAIYSAENGGVGTDAQRQCEHGNGGEPRALAQCAQPVAKVLQ